MIRLAFAALLFVHGIVRRDAWAIPLTVGVTLVSLIACLLDSPAAILGGAVDVAILLGLAIASVAGQRLGSHPSPAR